MVNNLCKLNTTRSVFVWRAHIKFVSTNLRENWGKGERVWRWNDKIAHTESPITFFFSFLFLWFPRQHCLLFSFFLFFFNIFFLLISRFGAFFFLLLLLLMVSWTMLPPLLLLLFFSFVFLGMVLCVCVFFFLLMVSWATLHPLFFFFF